MQERYIYSARAKVISTIVISLFVLVMLGLAYVVVQVAGYLPKHDGAVVITAPITNNTPEYQLASIEAGDSPPSAGVVAQFRTQIEGIAAKTGDSSQDIANLIVIGHQQLIDEYGKTYDLLDFAKSANATVQKGPDNQQFDKVIGSLVFLLGNS